MTMQLVGPYMTTTSYKKRKQKQRTKAQQVKFEQQHREYNKSMKRIGAHSQMMTIDDYDLYVRGMYKPKKQDSKPYVPKDTYKRPTERIPSIGNGIGTAPVREQMTYSGERQLLGIATMHKSNMVPIFADRKEEAVEIASMRR
ncbi:hypothetical protein OAE10_01300 [bacterium]|jgi:hypothetical protein|nr:hypothetical protein [bacterium]